MAARRTQRSTSTISRKWLRIAWASAYVINLISCGGVCLDEKYWHCVTSVERSITKEPLWWNSRTFSYTIGLSYVYWQISIFYEHKNSRILDLYFRNLRPPFSVENLRKWCHFLKKTARVEIIITISVDNCTNIWAKVFVTLYSRCCAKLLLWFQPVRYFRENDVIFNFSNSRKYRIKSKCYVSRPHFRRLWYK